MTLTFSSTADRGEPVVASASSVDTEALERAIEYGPAAIRTVLRVIDVLPFLYLLGFIVLLVTDRNQRLGDIVADTVVVRASDGGAAV